MHYTMVDTGDFDSRPSETDGDVDMIDENDQEVEEPLPRLMITKMVRIIICSTVFIGCVPVTHDPKGNSTHFQLPIAYCIYCPYCYELI